MKISALSVAAIAGVILLFAVKKVTGEPGMPPLPAQGKNSPIFKVTNVKTQAVVSNADFAGKVVMLDFFASWCQPCKETRPTIESFYKKHRAEGLVLLPVSNETPDKVLAYIKNYSIEDDVFIDDRDQGFTAFGVEAMPTVVVIDRKGKVVFANDPRESGLEKAVLDALAEKG